MKPEEQRITIAEACGAKGFKHESRREVLSFKQPEAFLGAARWELDDQRTLAADIPDYLNDRNAMAEAFNTLTPDQMRRFAEHLMDLTCEHPVGCVPDWKSDLLSLARLTHAPLPFIAEAFLKTLDLWKP
jgi:hypothetical protein